MELSKLLKEKIEKQISSWDAEIEAAESKAKARQAEAVSDAADAELEKEMWGRIRDLKVKVGQGREYLAELADAGEDTAGQIKAKIASFFD